MYAEHSITRRGLFKAGGAVAALAALGGAAAATSFEPSYAEETSITETKAGGCHSCHFAKCTMRYTVRNGILVGCEGDPDGSYNQGRCCVRGQGNPAFVYNPYRVKTPLKRTNPEKGLDVDPGWVEISYDEAIDLVVEQLERIQKDDPRKVIGLMGFPTEIYSCANAFAGLFGSPNTQSAIGSLCSVHLSSSLVHGDFVQFVDADHVNYVLCVGVSFGPNQGAADGTCLKTADGKARGARVVVVDPHCTSDAAFGEWVPIRPSSDLAFLLSVVNVIICEMDEFDKDFVKTRTTAAYLINPQGNDYVRDAESGKPLVFDEILQRAVPFDDADLTAPALTGEYVVNDAAVKPAFQWVKEGVSDRTPEWAEEVCTISASKIREIAHDLVNEAQIGQTIDINGVSFPYRPACVHIGRGLTNHRDGHIAYWTAMLINQLLGSLAVPGSDLVLANPTALTPDKDGVVVAEGKHSKFYPFQSPSNYANAPEFLPYAFAVGYRWIDAIHEPERYNVAYTPEMLICNGGTLFTKALGHIDRVCDALRSLKFIMHFAHHLDEQSQFSDVIFPDATFMEQSIVWNTKVYRPGNGRLTNVLAGHKAIIEPLYGIRNPDEVYLDIAERLGLLYGAKGFNASLNQSLALKGEYALDLNTKYTKDEIVDRRIRCERGMSLDEFTQKGYAGEPVAPEKEFNYYYFPGNKTHHPFYNMAFVRAGAQLKAGLEAAGVKHPGLSTDDIDFYYAGVPHWKETPSYQGRDEYDMFAVIRKLPQFLFDVSGVVGNPWLVETAQQNPLFGKLLINSETARERGLEDGDLIVVKSQFGGEIGPYPVKLTETVHPECIGIWGGNGRYACGMNPLAESAHIPFNRLLSTDWDSVDVITGGIDLSPRVKIEKYQEV